ncbi:hypothetical protein OESDEN_08598 [Oesophagostomum dentatum]|uniref:MULE transposase domain-containing protein n=1 Tax=Oesophagostomum dentatum TaxID=61180 RepID=A0A0B1T846_OESDE|nr:hypothetical protein OESDEN_08598 [Oesophagostomum dentatum]
MFTLNVQSTFYSQQYDYTALLKLYATSLNAQMLEGHSTAGAERIRLPGTSEHVPAVPPPSTTTTEIQHMEPETENTTEANFIGTKEEHIEQFEGEVTSKKVVLDFEKAAIGAAKKVINACVKGCTFHLAQAWNRRRDSLGLASYITGQEADARITPCWQIIKGVVFLSPRLRREVRALRSPPVPQDHESYNRCDDFLKYLRRNWLTGVYKDGRSGVHRS